MLTLAKIFANKFYSFIDTFDYYTIDTIDYYKFSLKFYMLLVIRSL